MADRVSTPAVVKVYCDKCGGGERNHAVMAEHRSDGSKREYDFHWSYQLQICQCLGCDTFRFREVYTNSEDVDFEGQVVPRVRVYPEVKSGSREALFELVTIDGVGHIYQETVAAQRGCEHTRGRRAACCRGGNL